MDIQQLYRSARIHESAINKLRNNIVDEIAEILSRVNLPNVQRVSSSPLVVIVPSSVVFSNSWNMSAEYYISEIQTQVLMTKIKNKQTVYEIKHFIDAVILAGYIMIDSRNKMFINSAVRDALIKIATMLQ